MPTDSLERAAAAAAPPPASPSGLLSSFPVASPLPLEFFVFTSAMEPSGLLQKAHTGAFEGFITNSANAKQGHLDANKSSKGNLFFTERQQKEKEQQDNIIVHDREYPQPPPHFYVPGPPSPLHFGLPLSDQQDPGVYAVSHALFGGSPAFTNIPLTTKPVFRRRRRGDGFPEWSNAFVTRVDPCECVSPEETYTPYEVARYRDREGRTQTTLSFHA
ncbi:hypothetical protein Efla_002038 [Eimeria flavescens]